MIKHLKTSIAVVGRHIYLIASDPHAGRRNRFTMWRLDWVGLKRSKVVAREFTLAQCTRLIVRLEKP